ncbi:hypothetical protein [Streptomyces roseicoloratus]|uniref:Nucleotidyltransferase n=1 Tax=Streptomyces roseicoloratus TaxID=2508722 RepID=A0ABY9S5C8_9ACTN|nr:hypothetical protein [Streptomyces roseicoloratus]WMX48599.1 hypothetical protein RGF97_32650 [Streptomyces roseicoloratus]
MNTALLYRLLDTDPADGPAELFHRARAGRHLPHLVLSALARDGVRMGQPARAELRRARDRAAHYARLAAELARSTGVRAIRGLPLAGLYPAGLLRPLDTLDLVAPDQAALWQAVIRLVTDHPVEHIDVSLLGDRPHHTAVTVHWPAEDPLADPWYRVHLSTAALPGNGSTVPVRPYLVADQHVECLIALAEARLRCPDDPPCPVTVLDVAGLTGRPFEPAETAAVLAAYRLAPEAAGLLDHAADHLPLGPLAAVRAALAPELGPERRRRAGAAAHRRLVTRHGTLLRRTVIRHAWDESRLLTPAPDTPLLLTPVADYLLTPTPVTPVTPTLRTAALKALHAWDAAVC